MHTEDNFLMIAKTLEGLENVLAMELDKIGAKNIEVGNRMVSYYGDKRLMYESNFRLRTALRIIKPIYRFTATNPDELYNEMINMEWDEYLGVDKTFAIDAVVYSTCFSHSKYASYKAKDAIADYFRKKYDKRPSVKLDEPDVLFNIHISEKYVTVSIDSSGESLHKRGYREVQTIAPINEVLAAGILLISGWDGQSDFLDPMCGSGTFLIEAALIARNIAPGVYRKQYAFQKWDDYDAELFDEIYNDETKERPFNYRIIGSDISSIAVEVASRNVSRAGLKSMITIEKKSFNLRDKPENTTLIVTNPPYGERLKVKDMESLYSMIGERLKHNYNGCQAWIIAHKKEHFDFIGLKHKHKVKLMNGSLPCELRGYDLFEGKHKDFKKSEPQFKKMTKDPDSMDKFSKKDRNKRVKDTETKNNRTTKQNKKTNLWPTDRFRERENKQHFNRRLQVYMSEDLKKED